MNAIKLIFKCVVLIGLVSPNISLAQPTPIGSNCENAPMVCQSTSMSHYSETVFFTFQLIEENTGEINLSLAGNIDDKMEGYTVYKMDYCGDDACGSIEPAIAFSQTGANTFDIPLEELSVGYYLVEVNLAQSSGILFISMTNRYFDCQECPGVECEDCIGSFSPMPGEKYIITGWAKQSWSTPSLTTFQSPYIKVEFPGTGQSFGPFKCTGNIIEGWQRIEGVFEVPSSASDIKLEMGTYFSQAYFDDIRILPFDATLTSYVYDPVQLRLVAELDDRHYATIYEYDQEGQLVRVKKETSRGVVTINEVKNYLPKDTQ